MNTPANPVDYGAFVQPIQNQLTLAIGQVSQPIGLMIGAIMALGVVMFLLKMIFGK